MLIAHLSDPHVCAPGQLYQDLVDSNAMLAEAVRQVASLLPAPDVVVFTGDMTEHATAEEYAHARALLTPIRQPLLVIAGNHDSREALRAGFADHAYLPRQGPLHFVRGDLGPVRIIGFDVTVPGHHHGDVDDVAAAWLVATLAAEPERPAIILMHQPPFETGIGFIDPYRTFNGDRLASIVARHPQVERILCGHVHRAMQVRFGGTLLAMAPSTTTAIALRLEQGAQPASFVEPPAFLLHHWRPAIGMVTHHVPIGHFRGPMPFF